MRYNHILAFLFCLVIGFSCESDMTAGSDSGGTGQGGSMTRFAISGDHMYVVDHSSIQVFSLVDQSFEAVNTVSIAFGMETIFARGEYLYLGASDAMYIFSIANPQNPSFVLRYSHILSCDPVVVQGNRAYVTLRSGNRCNRGANALEILDISDPYNPKLIRTYDMENPHGLAVDNNFLFLCEGEFGLKVFDITDERKILLLDEIENLHAYDVIARSGTLTLTGEDGIFQYRYATGQDGLVLLSRIPVSRTDV